MKRPLLYLAVAATAVAAILLASLNDKNLKPSAKAGVPDKPNTAQVEKSDPVAHQSNAESLVETKHDGVAIQESVVKSLADSAETLRQQAKREAIRTRYSAFFSEMNLSEPQASKLASLLFERDATRSELQSEIRKLGLPGNHPDVLALRARLMQPIQEAIVETLGSDNVRQLAQYEQALFYKEAYVNRIQQAMAVSDSNLDAQQEAKLARIIAANNNPRRRSASDLSLESAIDWTGVLEQATGILTERQLAALKSYTEAQSKDGK